MDHEKYPMYFMFSMILYICVLLSAMGTLILPGIGFGLYGELSFYIIFIPLMLPLFFFVAYEKIDMMSGQKKILRTLTAIFVIIDTIIMFYINFLLI